MGKLFGTDGIRGRANAYPITVEMALKVGRAVAADLRSRSVDKHGSVAPRVAIGRDTRQSGPMIEGALVAGLCAAGCDCDVLGVVPTPAVAYFTRQQKRDAGIVISASHNPYFDNGIKLFGDDGCKLDDAREIAIETAVLSGEAANPSGGNRVGQTTVQEGAADDYIDFLTNTFSPSHSVTGMPLVIDCANGATSDVAPALFNRLGMNVTVLANQPDGININHNCGSEHPERLAEAVRKANARVGFAFDGDGDRLIVVDETGSVLTGDQIIALCAAHIQQRGQLNPALVITTVMSNLGFGEAMGRLGIRHETTAVGDRHVTARMRESGALVGGEDSGHMVFSNYHTTGDGMLSSLRVLEAMAAPNQTLSSLATVMSVYPQILMGVEVATKPELSTIPEIQSAIRSVETELADKGRVLVRYSGTQPICRVMVEGPTESQTRICCERIAKSVEETIGK